jgi:hypothetical protein
MFVVKPIGTDFDGSVRCGKRLIVVEQRNGRWEADVDGDELVAMMNAGFVKPESPMAKPAPERTAPAPAVDVIVVEKKAAPKKAAPKKAAPKKPVAKKAPKKAK